MNAAKGYIGLTDSDWYSFLSAQPRVDEVNFWQPHGARAFRALRPCELFFFKLRAPKKAIAGFGFFERFESLPAWSAWECFGEMNGAPDFESMIERISRLRGDEGRAVRSGDFRIGCVMISAPFSSRRANACRRRWTGRERESNRAELLDWHGQAVFRG